MSIPQIPHYEFLELIGEGCCGYAYRCRYRDSDERMVKVVKGLSVNKGLFVNAMKTVAASRPHHHLVDVCGYEFSENPGYYITSLHGQPRADGSWKANTIEPLMGNLPVGDALKLIDQMADGLAHLHRLEVPHTAFKPSNLFLDENPDGSRRVRITGWAEGYVANLNYLRLGDRGFYASPEQLAKGDFSFGRAKRWDVYAFGVVAYRMLTGIFPRLDPQYDAYVELRKRLDVSDPDAVAFSKMLEKPAYYVEWIAAQPEVRWPGQPRSQAEADRRQVIEQCLDIDTDKRFGDMREVVAEFRQVESAYLLRRMERDLSNRSQQVADELETRLDSANKKANLRRRQVIKWRVFAVGLVASVGLLSWGAFKVVSRQLVKANAAIEELESDAKRRIAEERLRFDMALAEKDTAVATVSRTAVQRSEAADAARDVLRQAQLHGDRFFEMILNNRDSDVPGYRDDRRQRLVEAQEHYESLLEVYANNNSFVEQSANAYRYLGEIYLEINEPQRAAKAFDEAVQRLEQQRQSGDAGKAVVATESLAQVRQRQAELAARTGPAAAETLAAIDAAQAVWGELAAVQPDDVRWLLVKAQNQTMKAEVMMARGDAAAGMASLEQAADGLVTLHEKYPENDGVTASLGRVFAAIGGMQADADELEQAEELLNQSVALFSEAVTLNGAVDDYQYWMAESLAALGGLRRDANTLNDAVTVLSVAQSRNSTDPRVASILAVCLGTLAEMQRDGGETVAAIEFERRAVSALEQVLGGGANGAGKSAHRVRYLLAERNCHLAELHGDLEQFAESKKAADKAIELLASAQGEALKSASNQRLLARAQGLAAFASEKIGDKEGAKELYSAAMSQWQAVSNAYPDDSLASEGFSWAKRQFDALQ